VSNKRGGPAGNRTSTRVRVCREEEQSGVAADIPTVVSLHERRAQLSGLLKWAGGKAALSRTLIPIIRSRRPKRLIEPFAGGAAIFFRLEGPSAVLGDCNDHLMRFYLAVKKNPKRVNAALNNIRMAARSVHGPAFSIFYYEMREQFPRPELFENAALFMFLNRHCWNGLYRENIQGKFNTPIGSYESLQPMPELNQLAEASRKLKGAALRTADFAETLALAEHGDLVYLDPPYIPVSSSSRFSHYQGQAFAWRDHIRLKRLLYELRERGVDFILSNSHQKLTQALYSDFHQYAVTATGTINSRGGLRQARKELLVTSFTSPAFEVESA
jgi:DNA adenine methylase